MGRGLHPGPDIVRDIPRLRGLRHSKSHRVVPHVLQGGVRAGVAVAHRVLVPVGTAVPTVTGAGVQGGGVVVDDGAVALADDPGG
eukprot:CAMPEP_0204297372 /NCGR_PEP_ID=MMETSP0468-20130131/73073_1 /ASSEMBLY_ACC=CAM_ASM_000383 /TAXON_ID=2969 /ORGANISM="Oxyrrhis marina" /LENGTH=84 /DNA_ID=CAMNT_0051276157 /DNA_START=128 /DNA_END=379 /DNA_ORIENTATION=+